MSQIVVKRPPRVRPPEVPEADVQVQPPPELPRPQHEGVLMQLLPLLGMGGSVVFFFVHGRGFMKVMGCVMLASSVAMAIAMVVRHRRGTQGELAGLRRDYLGRLARTRRAVLRTAARQRDAAHFLHPAPDQLWALVADGGRVWERRAADADFGQVRIGLGRQRLATALRLPETEETPAREPLSDRALRQFVQTHDTVDGMPMALSLRAFARLAVGGEQAAARSAVRAVVASLVALHSPDDLVVAVVADRETAPEWEWAKWLPHVQAAGPPDGAGSRRLVCGDVLEAERLLGARLGGRGCFRPGAPPAPDVPQVVLVLDGVAVPPLSALAAPEGLQGVTVVELLRGEDDRAGGRVARSDEDPSLAGTLAVTVDGAALRLESAQGVVYDGEPDRLSLPAAEALARQLAPLRTATGDDGEPLLAALEFTDLLALGDAARVDPATTWRPRSPAERLRVPIGVGEDGRPVLLDLKEAAQDGTGPHGLCVGATGSGKSELLRTLVLGLAVTHSSETLNFVLADFKGGATFAGMARLPHVAAVITNLADDLTLVDRMGDSLRGELNRRQELLRDAGNFASVHDYERARAAGAPLRPIPSLLLVVDEFSELLAAMPDFIDTFVQIGRIGRSLGVHLLLASQRLEEGRLRGLETYLSYRIGLRTFSAAESRAALGVPDAYQLPNVPGSGYLKSGTDDMVRFKAAYVSGPYRDGALADGTGGRVRADRRAVLFTAAPVPLPAAPPVAAVPEAREARDEVLADTVLDVLARRLEGQGPAAHRVWLPPLDTPPPLGDLVEGAGGGLVVPLGVVDRPYEQRRTTLTRDFSGAAGHLQVVGGPQSGKSTFLRTLIAAFALTHSPHDVQFYGLDFGGGGMAAVAGLPHVGGVASRLDPERVRRTVAEVHGVMLRREEYFRAAGVDSIATYRARRADGGIDVAEQPWGDVFLVIDGWGTFRAEYEHLEPAVLDIAARGLGYGVHLVIGASRSLEVRANLKDHLMNRLELRLGDPLDSDLDRKAAARVPAGVPGRGLLPEQLHFMAAVPRTDGVGSADGLAEATAALGAELAGRWGPVAAPAVRLLPRALSVRELAGAPGPGIAFGIDESELAPVQVDFDQDPFFLVLGESESGKTNLLRLLVAGLVERHDGDACKVFVIDNRRGLLDAVPESHLAEYVPMSSMLEHHVDALADLMRRRTPPPDVTSRQLRERSWWSGPVVYVVVDDYELVSTSAGNPLAKLTEYLPFARDVGVRFVLARGTAGAGRAGYEPFVQRMRELGAQGVVLSGDPAEGEVLGGVRPRALPAGRGVFVSRRRGNLLVQTGRVE
ncbi:type VII secretion protein EccCa [Streptomyces sp. NPDC060194]|uniref:type VII secretion protein EccCa n=1 Tax=Streptomyces sp. NPDC060194 TaxID=3347069 RepID=UPI0036607050